MRGNRKTGSSPEVRLRSALHRRGFRFRKNPLLRVGGITVRPDVVFTRHRVAVFVDGCFWHGCPAHGNTPRANTDYWIPKLARNRARDDLVTTTLQNAGWTVLRIWEHETVDEAVGRVAAELATRA